MSIKSGRGRPTRYTTQSPRYVTDYIQNCLKNKEFPTIEGLAHYLDIGARTIYGWTEVHRGF